MADQLSLRLEPTTPRLPLTLRPMLAQTALEAFDSPDHLFEPNWGGMRTLAFIEAAGDGDRPPIRLLDERGRDVAPLLPELRSLADRVGAESVVLDGEVVVVDRMGRGDSAALASRLRGKPGPPVAFLAFDVIFRNGRPLFNEPLEKRRDALRRLLRPGDEAIAVPAIVRDGRALYEAVMESGIAGVMGRLRRSPYLPGVRSRMWQFVARTESGAAGVATTDAEEAAAPSGPPVLALIRRLPLDDIDP